MRGLPGKGAGAQTGTHEKLEERGAWTEIWGREWQRIAGVRIPGGCTGVTWNVGRGEAAMATHRKLLLNLIVPVSKTMWDSWWRAGVRRDRLDARGQPESD